MSSFPNGTSWSFLGKYESGSRLSRPLFFSSSRRSFNFFIFTGLSVEFVIKMLVFSGLLLLLGPAMSVMMMMLVMGVVALSLLSSFLYFFFLLSP